MVQAQRDAVPEALLPVWDLIVRDDGATIDFDNPTSFAGPLLKRARRRAREAVTDDVVKLVLSEAVTSMNISWCYKLTDEAIKAIAENCPSLKSIILGSELTTTALKEIGGCRSLESIDVSLCRNLTDEVIETIAKGCSSLKSITVAHNSEVPAAALKAIRTCRALESIDFSRCYNLTDEAIKAIAADCHSLQSINISRCDKVTNEAIKAIAKDCRRSLVSVNISGDIEIENHWLSSDAIKELARGCTKLTGIDLSWCANLTDDAVAEIGANCHSLKAIQLTSMDFARSHDLSDSAIIAIADGCPLLESIWVQGWRQLTTKAIEALSTKCTSLKTIDAQSCNVTALPVEIGDLLPNLEGLIINKNKLYELPHSIVKLEKLHKLEVHDNPLEEPPLEIAERGLQHIAWYFEELNKDNPGKENESKLIKAVFIGDGLEGKTSMRNALARRPNPRQAEEFRTPHLEIERTPVGGDVDANLFDCGGQREYVAGQLPYLTGLALYILVLEATSANDEKDAEFEAKVGRFLVLLLARAPGAVVMLVVSKVDEVDDPEKACRWFETKVKKWLEEQYTARRNHDEYQKEMIPLRIQTPALAVWVEADRSLSGDLRSVFKRRRQSSADSVQAVRNKILAIANHRKPSLLRGVRQRVPASYRKVLMLFGAIVEHGDDESALQALCDGTARELGKTETIKPNVAYRPIEKLWGLWERYRRSESSPEIPDYVFDCATRLWQDQDHILVDAGLVFLQPVFITKIVKPLVDRGLNKEVESEKITSDATKFLRKLQESQHLGTSSTTDRLGDLLVALNRFVTSGGLGDEVLLLPFLWRNVVGLHDKHYEQILEMLGKSGVIRRVQDENYPRRIVAIVPSRLPPKPDRDELRKYWKDMAGPEERQLVLEYRIWPGCPAGLSERFALGAYRFGDVLYAWLEGAVIKQVYALADFMVCVALESTDYITVKVRFPSKSAENETAAWTVLGKSRQMLEDECSRYFSGLAKVPTMLCEECLVAGRTSVGEIINWDESKTECGFTKNCGRTFRLRQYDMSNGADQEEIRKAVKRIVEKQDTSFTQILEELSHLKDSMERSESNNSAFHKELFAKLEHNFNVVVNQEKAMLGALTGLAQKKHKHPTLFQMERADDKGWTGCLNIGSEKLRIVFWSAEPLEPAPYEGQRGLEFRVIKDRQATALENTLWFCQKCGPIIKAVSISLTVAAKVGVGLNLGPILSEVSNEAQRALDIYDYGRKIRHLIDKGAPGDVNQTVSSSYDEFGEFLKNIGFEARHLPTLEPKPDENGNWRWVTKAGHATVPPPAPEPAPPLEPAPSPQPAPATALQLAPAPAQRQCSQCCSCC
ncbi:hypothetical protein CTAYLR_006125 [Chrysophaeum taylorii]|uniref:F-box/LRR-repeat protein 15-like leucin rich repeat domain-containing protein n=1 Tax=Chrysophaeum taylorii TaxID=2483200 RepID=A0AAD7UNC0_9STRA|nr:hypothetical protein CTAYLR_006125 [Chrysophaeum taylorii]